MLKNFNKDIFILSCGIYIILIFPSIIAVGAEDEGTLGTNLFWLFFAKLFYILRFPSHTLLWRFIPFNALLFFMGLGFNAIFYGLIFERFNTYLKTKKQ